MTLQEQEQPLNTILQGNVLDRLQQLPAKRFKTVVTSSPYYKMRFYGTELQVWDGDQNCSHEWDYKTSRQHAGRGDAQKGGKYSEQEDYPDIPVKSGTCKKCNAWLGELGQEPTRDKFLEHLWQIGDQFMRVLDDDGTLWFNIGDKRDPDGSLYNIPHAFVEGMLKRGWSLIDDVVWFKRSVTPQSDPTKFTPDYEPIFHFAKRDAPIFYANAKLGILQREEPAGLDGEEGKDWYWKLIKPHKKTYTKLRELKAKNEPLDDRFKEGLDDEGKPAFFVKTSLWQPYSYFHETQYRQYSEASLKQIERAYNGKSKKFEQATLDGLTEGLQDPSDTKRNIVESMKENLLPRYGGNKADGYGNSTYSGEPWTPDIPKNMIRDGSIDAAADGEIMGDPEYGSYERTVWDIIPARFAEAHFATFPVELVLRCLKSSCPAQVCTKCGLGWRKMYSEERKATRPGNNTNTGKSGTDADPNSELHNSDLSRKREAIIRRQVGIMKCRCNAPTKPGIILDPFMGSGTTAIAAILLALHWIGIELNPEYIKLAMKRLEPYLDQQKLIL